MKADIERSVVDIVVEGSFDLGVDEVASLCTDTSGRLVVMPGDYINDPRVAKFICLMDETDLQDLREWWDDSPQEDWSK